MGETIEELRRLQAVELKLAGIRRTRESKQRRLEVKRRLAKQIEEKVERNKVACREQQARVDALSLEIAAREESINKHRQALNRAKTNKEYAGILAAMNTEKADNTKVEARVLELMKAIDEVKADGERVEAEMNKAASEVAKAEEQLRTLDAESREEREKLEAERDEFADKIAPAALEAFERAAQRHDGEAMAAVSRLRPKRDDYTCEGCNMNVTLEVVNALQTRDEIQLCGVCRRILYFETTAASK
jgi:predicted  nucleic acid-binding Zn-ribbon protein